MCRFTSGGARPVPEWFGDDGADAGALSEVLLDERAWPAFRVPFGAGHRVVHVHRNFVDEPGTDHLLTHSSWPRAETLSSFDGDLYGPGLSWRELTHIADTPDPSAPGVQDVAARLLLLLPALADDELPPDAAARVSAALTAVGAPEDSAGRTADHLLGNRQPAAWRPDLSGSPLSGGDHRPAGAASDGSALLQALDLTRSQSDALARALGCAALPPW
ncbi:hypothetical protein [Kitasatospora sp. MBT63]|nr:hypothetical protein [Kitasatospora sp. MBT63]